MTKPFQQVLVTPHWGRYQVVVQWTVPPEFYQGNFIVFRSVDGITGFEEVTHGTNIDHFVDTVVPLDRITEYFYRIVLQYKGKRYDSDVVSTYSEVDRKEFGLAGRIMREEFIRMRRCHEIKIFRQKLSGEICPTCSDKDTEQRIGCTLCETCFGTGITGGFEVGVDSHMVLVGRADNSIQDLPSGTGSDDHGDDKVRLLPYPPLRKGDLIVLPASDARWLVQTLTPYNVNDKVPVIYDAVLHILRRTDVRYKVK